MEINNQEILTIKITIPVKTVAITAPIVSKVESIKKIQHFVRTNNVKKMYKESKMEVSSPAVIKMQMECLERISTMCAEVTKALQDIKVIQDELNIVKEKIEEPVVIEDKKAEHFLPQEIWEEIREFDPPCHDTQFKQGQIYYATQRIGGKQWVRVLAMGTRTQRRVAGSLPHFGMQTARYSDWGDFQDISVIIKETPDIHGDDFKSTRRIRSQNIFNTNHLSYETSEYVLLDAPNKFKEKCFHQGINPSNLEIKVKSRDVLTPAVYKQFLNDPNTFFGVPGIECVQALAPDSVARISGSMQTRRWQNEKRELQVKKAKELNS